MPALFALSLFLLGTLSHVFGQDGPGIFTNATCYATYSWINNRIGQSPCLVAAYLAGVCKNGYSSLYAIAFNASYRRPAGTVVNPCQCSAPLYNLIQACSYCQDGQPDSWMYWTYYCPASYISKSFPYPTPAETEIPQLALLDPTLTGNWSYSDVLAYDRSHSASITPYAMTSLSTSSTYLMPSSTSHSTSSSITPTPIPDREKQSSGAGAIAGGVLGGIAVLVFLILGGRHIRSSLAANRQRPNAGWVIENSQSDLEQPGPGSSAYPKDERSVSATSPTAGGFVMPLTYLPDNPSDPSTFPPPGAPSALAAAGLLPFNPSVATPPITESPPTQQRFSSMEMSVVSMPTPANTTSFCGSPTYVG